MLDENRVQELAEQFEAHFSAVSSRILQDIGQTLKKTGELTPAQARKLQQMFTYGADVEKMTRQLARASGESMETVQRLYEQVAKEEQDWARPFYDAKNTPQIPFKENKALQNVVKAASAATGGNLRNLSRTTTVGIKTKGGFLPLGSFYKKTVSEAIAAAATGTVDYNTAVREAVKAMGEGGLRVEYESGYTRRLDSAVRQNVLDGISYVAQETAKAAGEEFGADGVELSAHSPCAPDHLPYQGRQYSKRDFEDLQASLKRPIGEWNCRHFPYPILLGISRPANSAGELRRMEKESTEPIEIEGKTYTRYECTQLQRKLETGLRYAKEERALYKAAGIPDLERDAAEKIRILSNKYQLVSEKAGLPTRAERMKTHARNKTFVEKYTDFGIMEMTRKREDGYIEPMPKKQLHRIMKNFKRNGGTIQMDEATDRYLTSKNAEAIAYNAKTILLKKNPGRAAVFEELIHATQYRTGENDGSYLSRLKCEISAQKKLLDNRAAYRLTEEEIKQTKKALRDYEKELSKYLNGR